jgi:HEAT repeat protein
VLEGLNALNAQIIKQAMKNASPWVRENAAMLSEQFPECLSLLQEMVNDSSIHVAFQATLSLGEFNNKAATSTLSKVLGKYGKYSWFRTAVLSSKAGSSAELLKMLAEKDAFFEIPEPWKLAFLNDLSNIITARNEKSEINSLLEILSRPSLAHQDKWQSAFVGGFIKAVDKSKELNPSKDTLKSIASNTDGDLQKVLQNLKVFYKSSGK